MDIKEKLTNKEKEGLASVGLELNVLKAVASQKEAQLRMMVGQLLDRLGIDKQRYFLSFNPGENVWEVKLKDGVIVKPGDALYN